MHLVELSQTDFQDKNRCLSFVFINTSNIIMYPFSYSLLFFQLDPNFNSILQSLKYQIVQV